jgi:hypothetical protein
VKLLASQYVSKAKILWLSRHTNRQSYALGMTSMSYGLDMSMASSDSGYCVAALSLLRAGWLQ